MSRNHDSFRIPRAGWEAAPSAGLASIDINVPGVNYIGARFRDNQVGPRFASMNFYKFQLTCGSIGLSLFLPPVSLAL
jgi:hypothetical protein